jgi:hypothetical protein
LIILRPTASVADSKSYPIAFQTMVFDPQKHVAEIYHVRIEANNDRRGPGLVRDAADVFNCQGVRMMFGIFRIGGDYAGGFARLKMQIHGEQHNARGRVWPQSYGRDRQEWLALMRD